ncbi:precursor of CEP9 [Amaranthus tricolor]|uniref:precursor of CEP9 n=1 Tax=Amaranthus tricolor TaxID=29722 RepID=UPI0025878096|nr:precursor of CEP9 [Amaranthus tricolor]
MAIVECMIKFLFLCILFICQILFSEGRHLSSLVQVVMINSDKISSQKANYRKLRTQLSYKSDHIKRSPTKTSSEITPDDSKPIKPTQSFMSDTKKWSQNKPTKNTKMSNTLETSVDDFRHTTPGRSPGAGHEGEDKRYSSLKSTKLHNIFPTSQAPTSSFSYSTLGITNDFRPTSPGSSPGAGHSETNQIAGGLDDYRPTSPGHSPGAGHASFTIQEPKS